jgi:hypothetical protein
MFDPARKILNSSLSGVLFACSILTRSVNFAGKEDNVFSEWSTNKPGALVNKRPNLTRSLFNSFLIGSPSQFIDRYTLRLSDYAGIRPILSGLG